MNASVLNASRLNMTGSTGKPGGGAGGYWPEGTPAAIRRSAVLWYDIAKQGATNETMAENPVLKDLSGHGHDATCYNFGWGGMSGIGGYKWVFDDFDYKNFPYSGNTITFTHSNKTTFEHSIGRNELIIQKLIPGTSIKVAGMQFGDRICLYSQINGNGEKEYPPIPKVVTIVEDGIYNIEDNVLPEPYIDISQGGYIGFREIRIADGHEVTLEQLPQYPGALVSDGVNDYCVAEGLPLLDDFTFITKRTINAQKNNSVGAVKGESDSGNLNNAFGFDIIAISGGYYYTSFGASNPDPSGGALGAAEIVVGTPSKINGLAVNRGSIADNYPYLWLMGNLPSARFAEEQLYTFLLFDRTLTDEEIEWVKNNLIGNNYTVEELDASLVEAWVFSGLRNEDAPATVTGERGRELSLRNFGYTAGSGFDGGCLVTDGVDDYGICADFPIKDTYTLIMKFATLNGKQSSAPCTTTYFEASGTRRNCIFPIYIAPGVPYASMLGRKKNVAASSELAAVWMNKEAFCGEAYDDTSGQYTPPEGQECKVYVGMLDDRGFFGGYKLAYLAFYDKVMTAEEAEAEVAKLEALWAQRSGGA